MRTLLAAAILSLVAVPARADFNAEVTASPDFAAGLKRVAVVAVDCHESIDCTQVEEAAAEELTERRPTSRSSCLPRCATSSSRAAPPSCPTSSGPPSSTSSASTVSSRSGCRSRTGGTVFGGSRRSEVRVEVRLVTRDGALRMSGRGSGRPKNVVSGTERVAGTVIEKILLKAFGTR